jgi:2-polyprenyl-3-methyl-5-hydroxy-6-metoxy-1,4-benzoquinol methylase
MYTTLSSIINSYLKDKTAVLELGCGNGVLINKIAQDNPHLKLITAMDYYNDTAKLLPSVQFIKQDLEEFSIEGKYDLVVLNQVFEHMKNPLGLLEKIKKNLNRHGRVLIVVPNRDGFNNEARVYLPEHGKHYFLWDKEVLSAGFIICMLPTHIMLLCVIYQHYLEFRTQI